MQGVLWELSSSRALELLDDIEGVPNLYERLETHIDHQNRKVVAWYYMPPRQPLISSPHFRYIDDLVQGYREHGISNKRLEILFPLHFQPTKKEKHE